MASPRQDNADVPQEFPSVPPDISAGTGHLRLVVQELKDDIKDIKSEQRSDFRIIVSMFGAGFLALAAGLLSGYLVLDGKFEKIDDRMDRKVDALSIKIDTLSNTVIRSDTKLQDLLERIPPVSTLPPTPPRRP